MICEACGYERSYAAQGKRSKNFNGDVDSQEPIRFKCHLCTMCWRKVQLAFRETLNRYQVLSLSWSPRYQAIKSHGESRYHIEHYIAECDGITTKMSVMEKEFFDVFSAWLKKERSCGNGDDNGKG